jgi:hypothetical protein
MPKFPIPNPCLTCNVVNDHDKARIEKLSKISIEKWLNTKVGSKDFPTMMRSDRPKESGHNFSGAAEEVIQKAIAEEFVVKDAEKTRDSADFLVKIDGEFLDFNSKLSIFDRKGDGWGFGRPNLVSLNRLFYKFLNGTINSYIVLYASVWVEEDGSYEVRTHLVDILQYLQFVAADSGPGQCMTKTEQLYYCTDLPTTDRIMQEDQLMTLRSKTSHDNLSLRRYQTMIDEVEMSLVRLRRKIGKIADVKTQVLRAVKDYTSNKHKEWASLKMLEQNLNLSSFMTHEDDKLLFLQYVS